MAVGDIFFRKIANSDRLLGLCPQVAGGSVIMRTTFQLSSQPHVPAASSDERTCSLPSGSSPFELAERYLSPVLSPFATLGRATKPQRHAVVLLVCAKVTIGAAELPDLLPLAAIAPRTCLPGEAWYKERAMLRSALSAVFLAGVFAMAQPAFANSVAAASN